MDEVVIVVQDDEESSENNNRGESGEEDRNNMQPEEPPPKKLRFSDPDLTVVIKYVKADGTTPAEKTYEMYASVLSKLSKVVDASLSVDMKEKASQSFTFEGVVPGTFEQALELLENPVAARTMKVRDVSNVIAFYDKYDFPSGLKLCDQCIHEYLADNIKRSTNTPPKDLDLIVQVLELADTYQLKKSIKCGLDYLSKRLKVSNSSPYGPTMFTVDHVRRLHSYWKQPRMREIVNKHVLGETLSDQEIDSSLFPKYFVTKAMERFHHQLGGGGAGAVTLNQIRMEGSRDYDGVYEKQQHGGGRGGANNNNNNIKYKWRHGPFHSYTKSVTIQKSSQSGDWLIVARVPSGNNNNEIKSRHKWRCRYSRHLPYPPKLGWQPLKPYDEGASKNIKLFY